MYDIVPLYHMAFERIAVILSLTSYVYHDDGYYYPLQVRFEPRYNSDLQAMAVLPLSSKHQSSKCTSRLHCLQLI